MRKSNSATRVLPTLCTFPTHWVSPRQETTASKNSNSVSLQSTSHALFYSGHLVMRSKRCAVQNQGITLRDISNSVILLDFGKGKNITCLLITCYSYWGILALSRGITDLAALGSYCHDWGPIFPSTARASSVSKLFIIWHSASDSKMHFRWLPWRILHNASNSDKSKLPRVRKTNSLIVKSS